MQGLREQITMDELFSMAEVFAQEPHSKAQMNYAGAFRYLFQRLGVKLNDRDLRIFAQTVARQMTDPQVPENLGVPAKQQCAFKAAMLLNGMDELVYRSLPETYARYLKDWTPDTQHSVWMVTGSRWTKPMSKVLTAAGAEGRVLCQAMKATLARFESGELTIPAGDPGTGGAHKRIVPELQNAVDSWEATYGTVKAGFPDGKGL